MSHQPSMLLTEEEQEALRKGVHRIPWVVLRLRQRLGLGVKASRSIISQFIEEEQAKPKPKDDEDGDVAIPSPS